MDDIHRPLEAPVELRHEPEDGLGLDPQHALGEAALCPDCRGAGRVRYPDEKHPDKPAPAPKGSEGYSWPCRECDGGYRVRYQAYKAEVVQTLAPVWEIDREEIVGWNLLSAGR